MRNEERWMRSPSAPCIQVMPLLTRGAAPDIMRKVRARGRLNLNR